MRQVQSEVKVIDERRQVLLREQSVAEHRVSEAIAKLKELGVENAGDLNVADLAALRDKTREALTQNLATVRSQIAEANKVFAEYEAVAQS